MDTRQSPRLKISSTIRLRMDSSAQQGFSLAKGEVEAEIIDISVGGIGLLSKYFIPKRVRLELEFAIENTHITVKGEVRSAISGAQGVTRLGIKFIDLSDDHHRAIDTFIKANERRAHSRLGIGGQHSRFTMHSAELK